MCISVRGGAFPQTHRGPRHQPPNSVGGLLPSLCLSRGVRRALPLQLSLGRPRRPFWNLPAPEDPPTLTPSPQIFPAPITWAQRGDQNIPESTAQTGQQGEPSAWKGHMSPGMCGELPSPLLALLPSLASLDLGCILARLMTCALLLLSHFPGNPNQTNPL